jgi:hypothetical protein
MILIVTLKNLLMIAVISMTLHRFLSVFSMLRDDLTYSACILTLIFSDHITQVHFKADRTNSSSVNASNTISSQ